MFCGPPLLCLLLMAALPPHSSAFDSVSVEELVKITLYDRLTDKEAREQNCVAKVFDRIVDAALYKSNFAKLAKVTEEFNARIPPSPERAAEFAESVALLNEIALEEHKRERRVREETERREKEQKTGRTSAREEPKEARKSFLERELELVGENNPHIVAVFRDWYSEILNEQMHFERYKRDVHWQFDVVCIGLFDLFSGPGHAIQFSKTTSVVFHTVFYQRLLDELELEKNEEDRAKYTRNWLKKMLGAFRRQYESLKDDFVKKANLCQHKRKNAEIELFPKYNNLMRKLEEYRNEMNELHEELVLQFSEGGRESEFAGIFGRQMDNMDNLYESVSDLGVWTEWGDNCARMGQIAEFAKLVNNSGTLETKIREYPKEMEEREQVDESLRSSLDELGTLSDPKMMREETAKFLKSEHGKRVLLYAKDHSCEDSSNEGFENMQNIHTLVNARENGHEWYFDGQMMGNIIAFLQASGDALLVNKNGNQSANMLTKRDLEKMAESMGKMQKWSGWRECKKRMEEIANFLKTSGEKMLSVKSEVLWAKWALEDVDALLESRKQWDALVAPKW